MMSKQANPEGIKWPTDKAKYDKNYLKLYGEPCHHCGGVGGKVGMYSCEKCNGIGYVEKK